MLSDEIMDEERLFRAVPNQPTYWKPKERRYSSAMFKQSKGNGISVDRDGGRTTEAIVASFARSRPEYGLVALTAGKCREIGTHPVAKPIKNNDYHAEIHESPDKIEISQSKSQKLARAVEEIVPTAIALASRSQQENQ